MRNKRTRVHTLLRVDNHPISDHQSEIRAFMPVRNEILRLPHTLAHYRNIGVARFFIIDNGSSDGSKEFLLAQPDCHIFVTQNSFAEARCGVEWQNALLDEYGTGRWCLAVDADEWFIYPGYESIPLAGLAAYLDRSGAQGMFSFLLDMYGPGRITDAVAAANTPLLDACRYFDREYAWHRRPYIPAIELPRFPEYDVFGGPRLRLLFPNLRYYYYPIRALWHTLNYLPIPLPHPLRTPPTLPKVPFVRWLPGTRYLHNHGTTPIKLSETTGVLLHFKFLQDFGERVKIEADRKEHWSGASEYARYAAKLRKNPSLGFHHVGSVAYEGSDQLVRLGLLREDKGWEQIRTAAVSHASPRYTEDLAPRAPRA